MLRRMKTSTSGNIGPVLRAGRRKWVYNVPRRTGHSLERGHDVNGGKMTQELDLQPIMYQEGLAILL